MTESSKEFRIDRNSPSVKLARDLARADHQLLVRLIQTRVDLGLSQADVAKKMGVSQPTVAAFERYDNDPKMSTVRRYAHALGVSISHIVDGRPVTTWEPSKQPDVSDTAHAVSFGTMIAVANPDRARTLLADLLMHRATAQPVSVDFEPSVIEYVAEDEPQVAVSSAWIK